MNLYQIKSEYLNLVNILIQSEGELTPELEESLKINKEELQAKGLDYGFVVRKLDSEIDIIDSEIKRLQGLKTVRNNAIERLKSNLKEAMMLYDVTEIKSPLLTINFRKSESVVFSNIADIPEYYITIKTERTPNKVAIKEAIKKGLEVNGALISVNQNIQIK